MQSNYYVYVYIDPRNFEEFYYGKGKGNRKNAHLKDKKDSEKTNIIKAIRKEGLEPIVKVIAKDLTEKEALLIEKTLIWKLGKNLTNLSSGHFADKFRRHHTFHLNLNGFDFENGLYYVNGGERKGGNRSWIDCRKFGFLSAGQHPKYSKPLHTLNKGDIIVAYLKSKGYVGIGKITATAQRVNDFRVNGKPLQHMQLYNKNIFKNCHNKNSEYLVKVKWIKSVSAEEAKWEAGLYAIELIKASLENQDATIKFLEKEFKVSFSDLLYGA